MTLLDENKLTIYTTKHAVPFQSQKVQTKTNFILHPCIKSAIKYADKNLCTIVCIDNDEVVWSGGPISALNLFHVLD